MLQPGRFFNFYYVSFLVMYILCIAFIYQKFSEIVAFFLLFIVHTSFSIFLGKDLLVYLLNNYHFLPMFTATSISITLLFIFISLILLIQLLISLRKKYTIEKGTPIYLPTKYQNELQTFKINLVIIFLVVFLLLCVLFLRVDLINMNFYDIVKNMSVSSFFGNAPTFIILTLSCGLLGLSGHQIYLANDLSYSQKNQSIR